MSQHLVVCEEKLYRTITNLIFPRKRKTSSYLASFSCEFIPPMCCFSRPLVVLFSLPNHDDDDDRDSRKTFCCELFLLKKMNKKLEKKTFCKRSGGKF